jgi:hypothetical protein
LEFRLTEEESDPFRIGMPCKGPTADASDLASQNAAEHLEQEALDIHTVKEDKGVRRASGVEVDCHVAERCEPLALLVERRQRVVVSLAKDTLGEHLVRGVLPYFAGLHARKTANRKRRTDQKVEDAFRNTVLH